LRNSAFVPFEVTANYFNFTITAPDQWCRQPRNLCKMFDFRQITLFSLEKRLSKHKMTISYKNFLGGMAPFAPPGYACASDTDFQNTGLCQISSKIPVRPLKYRPYDNFRPAIF